jgi:putative transposase
MIEPRHTMLSIRRQCDLLGLHRGTYYYQPATETGLNLELMRVMDAEYLRSPVNGYRKMTARLQQLGYAVNRKRVQRLMGKMGLQAIYPHPRTSMAAQQHKKYPYLLRDVTLTQPNQVCSADITYVPMPHGFMYLVAVMDWYSRFVLTWQLSNTLDGLFCLEALRLALHQGPPDSFNTDQSVQFTAQAFTDELEAYQIKISMDGRGRAFDNIFIERLWRTVKYEHIYLYDYETVPALAAGLGDYFHLYNYERPHQSLNYQTPADVHFSTLGVPCG